MAGRVSISPPDKGSWAALASPDLRKYARNLRRVGCPEEAIARLSVPSVPASQPTDPAERQALAQQRAAERQALDQARSAALNQMNEQLTTLLGEQAARAYRRVNGGTIPIN